MSAPTMDKKIVDQTTKNIALVGRLIDEILDGATELDADVRTTPLILIPTDDPGLARENFEMSLRLVEQGKPTRLQLLGKRPVDSPAWRTTDIHSISVTQVKPHWPKKRPAAENVRIIYDKSRDALLVTFRTRRPDIASIGVNPYVAVQFNQKTHEITGYLIVSFLQAVAPNSPTLVSAFRKAQFRRITERELGGILIQGKEEALSELETINVLNELSRLIA